MWLTFRFQNGQGLDVDTAEFGADAMGAFVDALVIKHGPIVSVTMNKTVSVHAR